MTTSLLHLSDLHIGNDDDPFRNDALADDDKTGVINKRKKVPNNMETMELLAKKISNLENKPDFVIVSGDIAHMGNVKSFSIFTKWVQRLISEGNLPAEQRIIVVPGNHDVAKQDDPNKVRDRWDSFFAGIRAPYIVPWIPLYEDTLVDMKEKCSRYIIDQIEQRKQTELCRLPFIFDKSRKIFIYALNSCFWCHAYDDTTTKCNYDLPRVHPDELELLCHVTAYMRSNNAIGPEFNEWLTVCIMHHHLSSLPVFEEVKSYEMLSNAGKIKKKLVDFGIKLVLHGHKHWPEAYYDTAISGGGTLSAISGGSICEKPLCDQQGFFVLDFDSLNNNYVKYQYKRLQGSDSAIKQLALYPILKCGNILVSRKSLQKKVSASLGAYILVKENAAGWDKYVTREVVGIVSTAIALVIANIVGLKHPKFTDNKTLILRTLWESRINGTTFSEKSHKSPSIEATCWVSRAFFAMNDIQRYKTTVSGLFSFLDSKQVKEHYLNKMISTFGLTILLETYLEAYACTKIKEYEDFAETIFDLLYNNSIVTDSLHQISWPASSAKTQGTPVHTSMVIMGFIKYHNVFPDKTIPDFIKIKQHVRNYLLSQDRWPDAMDRISSLNSEIREYYHSGTCWAIRALIELGVQRNHEKIHEGMRRIMSEYDQGMGLWHDDAGEYPIWKTYDALTTIDSYVGQEFYI